MSTHVESSTVSRLAAELAVSACVAALVAVPLFFNLHSDRIFEEEKIALLRSLALVAGAALLVRAAEEGRVGWQIGGRPMWRAPMVLPALALAGAYGLATLCSIAPHASLWGSYVRLQGTYTFASYLIVFSTLALVVRRRAQVESVVTLIVIASVPACAYALVQHSGLDPVRWGTDVTARVHAGAGNPIFLGAYLIMVVPLTLTRLLQAMARLGARGTARRRHGILAGTYLAILLLQLIALVYTQSRGPVLGLAAGLFAFVVLAAIAQRVRWLLTGALAGAIVLLAFLIMLNIPKSPLAPLREAPYVGRLGRVFAAQEGSGRVRVLVWQGAVDLLRANPWRLLVGYGPETMYVAYQRVYPPELGHHEKRNTVPDRAHNAVFDALITTGLAGLAAEMAVMLACFLLLLQPLGVVPTARDARRCGLVVLASGLIACAAVAALDGQFRFVGVALPAGMLAGVLGYAALASLRPPEAPAPLPGGLLWIGCGAMVIAHFIESQLGIPVVATRLYFWAALALLIALSRAPAGEPARPRAPDGVVQLAVMVGAMLIVLTFDLYRSPLARGTLIFVPGCLWLSVWAIGAVLALAHAEERVAGGRLVRRAAAYAGVSLGCWIPFLIAYPVWLRWRPTTRASVTLEQAVQIARNQSHATTLLYGALLAMVVLAAVTGWWASRSRAPFSRRPRWQVALYPLALAGVASVMVATNLNVSRADIFSRNGAFFERKKKWAAAAAMYEQALRLQPQQDRYTMSLGRALVESAQWSGKKQSAERDAALARAEAALERAHRRSPLDVDHVRNLARLHRTWAGLLDDPAEQTRHRDQADALYGQASVLAPTTAALWDEWALLHLERNDRPRALAKLGQALRIDRAYATSYWIRAHVYLDQGRLNDALRDFDLALAADPYSVGSLTGKAMVLFRMGRLTDAIAVNEQVLELQPRNVTAHRNLAVLYQQLGQPERALPHAQTALAHAQPEDKPPLEEFIKTAEAQLRGDS